MIILRILRLILSRILTTTLQCSIITFHTYTNLSQYEGVLISPKFLRVLVLRFAIFIAMVLRWTERILSCFIFADNPPLLLYTHFPPP